MTSRITGQALPGYITTTNCQEYDEGELAYKSGLARDSCPYPKGDKRRLDWMSGFFEARIQSTLGHIFRKYGH